MGCEFRFIRLAQRLDQAFSLADGITTHRLWLADYPAFGSRAQGIIHKVLDLVDLKLFIVDFNAQGELAFWIT